MFASIWFAAESSTHTVIALIIKENVALHSESLGQLLL